MAFSISTIVWLVLIIVFALLEAATIGLVSIWFAAGAVAALLVSLVSASWLLQLAVFLAVSAAALLFTRPLVKKHFLDKLQPTNADRNIGRKASVIVAIRPDVPGRVRLDGVDWAARSDEPLAEGSLCVVQAVESATLVVCSEKAAAQA